MPTYFTTDLHGELAALDQLLHRLALTRADILIFGGDHVDRGAEVYGVIERRRGLSRHREVVTLLGNHNEALAQGIVVAERSSGRYDATAYAATGAASVPPSASPSPFSSKDTPKYISGIVIVSPMAGKSISPSAART